jgi:hypothetical protein
MSWDRRPSPGAFNWLPAMVSLECGGLPPLLSALKAGASSRTPKWAESTTRGEQCLYRICATSKRASEGGYYRHHIASAPVSGEDRSQPLRKGFLEVPHLTMIDNGHLTIRHVQVAVVVNQDIR